MSRTNGADKLEQYRYESYKGVASVFAALRWVVIIVVAVIAALGFIVWQVG